MIHLENVCKSFHNEHILKDINLHIQEGECVVLKGVSGSGKSTLLSIIGTLMKASSGKVFLDDTDILKLNDYTLSDYRASMLGFVTQSFHLFDKLNVEQNISTGLLLSSLSKKEIAQKVQYAMEIVSMQMKSDAIVSQLSGGEKQRCIIARALVHQPKILLCDEPTANLDKENSMKFIEIIKKLNMMGKTIVIATHDPLISELEFIDRVIQIDGGRIE